MTTDKWKLPDTWAWGTLADLTEIKGGVTVDKKRTAADPVTLPYLRVANVQNGYLDLREVKEIVVDHDRAEKYFLRSGDILLNEGGDRDKLGRGWVWSGQIDPCIHQNHVFRARPAIPELSSKFISYYANAFGQPFFMQKGKQSVNLASISLTAISGLPVPVAPLAEQHRIVEKIETLFARLDKGEEALREVQKLLARYRQSVLKAAVTGALTADWRAENAHRLEHGRDLLARVLKTRRETWQGRGKYKEPAAPDTSDLPELPEGWVWVSLDHLLSEFITGPFGSALHKSDYVDGGAPLVNPINIQDGRIVPDSRKGVDGPTLQRLTRFRLQESDIVIGRRGDMGRCAAVTSKEMGWLCGTGSMILRPTASVLSEFVSATIRTHIVVSHLEQNSVGTTMKNLNQRALLGAPIAVPSVDEQAEVIRAVQDAFERIDQLNSWCGTEVARSAALRQSILKDAFAGCLVPQDPDDESASELLARIKESGAAAPKKILRKSPAKVAS